MCLLAPGHLLGRISERDLVLLSASPDARVSMAEGSGVQGERIKDQMYRRNVTRENEEVSIRRRQEVKVKTSL